MRVHVCQHAPFEGLAGIDPWLRARGATIQFTRLFLGESLPSLEAFEWLVLMGGPMSVNDEQEFPWLRAERDLVAAAVSAGKTILGICLGAQMISKALGGTVSKNREREIGWFPVWRLAAADSGSWGACFPEKFQAFHWHGETFSIPPNAVHLLGSEACENQAFALGDAVLGLQFHCEMTPPSVSEMLEGDADGIGTGRYVQTVAEMRAGAVRGVGMTAVLDNILSKLAGVTAAKISRDRAR